MYSPFTLHAQYILCRYVESWLGSVLFPSGVLMRKSLTNVANVTKLLPYLLRKFPLITGNLRMPLLQPATELGKLEVR